MTAKGDDTFMDDDYTIDTVFLTKLESRGKLHSHLWLYRGFCVDLNPDYVVVIYK